MFKKLLSILLSLLLVLLCTGCQQEFSLDVIIASMPQNIDPQLAESDTESLIVRNIFEGLMRLDEQGAPVCGVAEQYTVDESNLVYEFTLREDAVWSNGQSVTAQDFVFAFRRAVDKTNKAPNANALLCIKNASQILDGNASPTTLGVTASSNKHLKIELSYADPYFLQTLASPVAMPCNEEFFYSCNGKYGLSEKFILSNGSFTIKKWKDQKKISLLQNTKYNGQFPAKASAVYLSTASGEKSAYELLTDSKADLAEILYTQEADAQKSGLNTAALQNTTYSLLFNKNGIFSNDELRKAFALSVHRNLYITKLPDYLQKADSIFPSTLSIHQTTLQSESLKNKSLYEFDAQTARSLFLNVNKSASIPTITVLYEENPLLKTVLTDIVSQWQQVLGAYVNIEALSPAALKSRVQSGNYTLAFYPLQDRNGNAQSFLQNFTTEQSINGFHNTAYDQAVAAIAKNQSPLENACAAEKLLLTDASVIPVLHTQRIFAFDDELKNVTISNTAGYMDLAQIKK